MQLPKGGTEIQEAYLRKHVKKELLDKISLTTSIPEKQPLVIDRSNVLWVHNSYDQANLAPWFKNKLNHGKYDWYVFNSHWTYEKYRYFFDIPTEQSLVITNGFDDDLVLKKNFEPHPKIKMVYTSTPWRGLDVLLAAMEAVQKNQHVELDVYSSTQIYGDHFKQHNDDAFKHLYEKAEKLTNVNYKGYIDHSELMKKLHTYDVYVHPSTFEETFCLAAMESLAAGLIVVTTDLGALPEVCAGFPIYVPYMKDKKQLAQKFAYTINQLPMFVNAANPDALKFQQDYYRNFYHWDIIKGYWENFLNGIK
jgi:glycosyltransferase involved in cell wall biosynthesis